MAEKKQDSQVEVKKVSTKGGLSSGRKKANVIVTSTGRAYITSTFNNTLITITNDKGDVIGWSSSGSVGFKGTRKSTPFAASSAMETVVKKQLEKDSRQLKCMLRVPEQAEIQL